MMLLHEPAAPGRAAHTAVASVAGRTRNIRVETTSTHTQNRMCGKYHRYDRCDVNAMRATRYPAPTASAHQPTQAGQPGPPCEAGSRRPARMAHPAAIPKLPSATHMLASVTLVRSNANTA